MKPFFAGVLLFVVGCSYTRHEGVQANGEDHQLLFTKTRGEATGAMPLGVARTFVVQRISAADVTCHVMNTSLKPQGGHPDLPPDRCDPHGAESVVLESAACDDDACIVTSQPTDGGVLLRVVGSGDAAVSSHLRVALKSTKDDTVWRDSVPVRFARADRFQLTGSLDRLAPLLVPVLPGITIPEPTVKVVDAAGETMSVDGDALDATIDGDVVGTDDYGLLTAKTPGVATLRWKLGDALQREEHVEVVDPSRVRSLVVHAASAAGVTAPAPTHTPPPVDLDDARDAAGRGPDGSATVAPGATVERIDMRRADHSARLLVFAQLDDGRTAIGPLDSAAATPTSLATAMVNDYPEWSAYVVVVATGEGTVDLSVAGVTTRLPLVVTP